MRFKLLAGAFLLLMAIAALPTADAQIARKIYVPMVVRDPTATPTNTPTPVPVQDVRIRYQAYVQDRGWLDWQYDNGTGNSGWAGTMGESRRVEGIKFEIVQGPPGVVISYRAMVQDIGWTEWVNNGAEGGRPGQGRQVEAIQVYLQNALPNTYLHVNTWVADWGELGWVRGLWIAGTTGQSRRMEAFKAFVSHTEEPARIHVAYIANPRGIGYNGWKRDGEDAGTRGESRPLNTFKAVLYNNPENMHLEYRCYVQDNDWQGWTDGECGIFSADKDIYAMEMRFRDGVAYPGTVLSYGAHIANRGDVNYSTDNPSSNNGSPIVGNPNDKFRIEAIRIGIGNALPIAR